MDEDESSSSQRALADLEIILAAYPDEVTTNVDMDSIIDETSSSTTTSTTKYPMKLLPLQFTIHLSEYAYITMEFHNGYPSKTGIQISSFRSDKSIDRYRLETTVAAVRKVSLECQVDEIEGGISCCSVALETWNDTETTTTDDLEVNTATATATMPMTSRSGNDGVVDYTSETAKSINQQPQQSSSYKWISGQPLMDRKSSFQAHVCHVTTEQQVREALEQLLTSSSKIQRATHNMYAWRVSEEVINDSENNNGSKMSSSSSLTTTTTKRVIIKHDNDDDGEDAAGSKLAYLLDMRNDENIIVVVSRWYGGIHLGPKRFAHIVNVARELLVEYNNNNTNGNNDGSGSTKKVTSTRRSSNNKNTKK